MSKATAFMLAVSTMLLCLAAGAVPAEELTLGDVTPPEIHASVALQMENYYGGDTVVYFGHLKDAKSGFVIRHASVETIGQLGDYIEYNMEIGTATCQGSLMGLMLMEAGLFYKPFDFLKVGFMKGHIMRGFTLGEECIEQVPAEKPRFCKTITPCHPTGAVIETNYDINETMGITAQFAYLNGTSGKTDNEHDINYGLIFHTPLQGLSISGYYNDWDWQAYDNREQGYNPYEGHRAGFGFNYDAYNVHLRSEYYHGRGFGGGPVDSVKMNALLAEVAYTFNLGHEKLSYIQPYVAYQWWDMFSNGDRYLDSTLDSSGRGVSDQYLYSYVDAGDYTCSYLAFGVSFGLGSSVAKLRIEYEVPLSFADDEYGHAVSEDNEANRLLIRLQTGI